MQFTIEPVESAEEKTDYSQEIDNPYRYAGYEYLDSVDLYDLNARYYNPKTARFLSEDPYYNLGNRVIGLYEINVPSVDSIIQANNIYAYCGNNPITYIDHSGNMAVAAGAAASAAAGAAATNWWNLIGWVAGVVLVVAVVAAAIDQSSSNGKSPSSKVGTKPSGNSPSTTDDEYEKAKDTGEAAPNNNTVRHKEGENYGLPSKGEPNSSTDLKDSDGTLKQRRYYGPDGKAQEDIDYKPSGDKHKFPHRHIWRWNGDKTERIPK